MEGVQLTFPHCPADIVRIRLLEQLIQASPSQAPCPICHAGHGEVCVGGAGRFHTARELLRIGELEAQTTSNKIDMPPGEQ